MKKGKVRVLFSEEVGTYSRTCESVLNVIVKDADSQEEILVNLESYTFLEKDGNAIFQEEYKNEYDYKFYIFENIDNVISHYKYTVIDTVTWLESLEEI